VSSQTTLVIARISEYARRRGDNWSQRRGLRRLYAVGLWAVHVATRVALHPMAAGRPLRAVLQQLRWEVTRRCSHRCEGAIVSLPLQARLFVPVSSPNLSISLVLPDWWEQNFILRFLRPGDAAVDVGANIGMYTVTMASTGASVFAFEPSASSFTHLCRNVELNGFDHRVTAYKSAVGDVAGTAHLTTYLDTGNRLIEDLPDQATEEVPVTTLDLWQSECSPGAISLVKVDVEGSDLRVLRGGLKCCRSLEPILMLEYWAGGDALVSWLEAEGFDTYRFDPEARTLRPFRPTPGSSGNLIACTANGYGVARSRLDEPVDSLALRPSEFQLAMATDGDQS